MAKAKAMTSKKSKGKKPTEKQIAAKMKKLASELFATPYGPKYDPALAGKGKKRGRPKGSKTKQYGPVYDKSLAGKSGRGRGRPKGSKNKPKNGKHILAPLKGKHHVKLEGTIYLDG